MSDPSTYIDLTAIGHRLVQTGPETFDIYVLDERAATLTAGNALLVAASFQNLIQQNPTGADHYLAGVVAGLMQAVLRGVVVRA